SSALVLTKLQNVCERSRIQLLFTGLSADVEAVLKRNAFDFARPGLHRFDDLDHALEWCENTLLAEADAFAASTRSESSLDSDDLRALTTFFESVTLPAGARLATQGEAGDTMF